MVSSDVNWCTHYGKPYGGLLKTKNKTTIWSSNSIPGYISEENENPCLKRYTDPNVHSSINHNSQSMEATEMDEENVMYTF